MKVKTQFDNLIKQEIIRSEKEYKKSLTKKSAKKTISKKDKIKKLLATLVDELNQNSLDELYAAAVVGRYMLLAWGATDVVANIKDEGREESKSEQKKFYAALSAIKKLK